MKDRILYNPERDIYQQPELTMDTPFGRIVSVVKDGVFEGDTGIPTTDRKNTAAVIVVIETPGDDGAFEILAGTRVTPFLKAGAAERRIGSAISYHQPDSIERIEEEGELTGYRVTYRMFFTDPDGNSIRVNPEEWK